MHPDPTWVSQTRGASPQPATFERFRDEMAAPKLDAYERVG